MKKVEIKNMLETKLQTLATPVLKQKKLKANESKLLTLDLVKSSKKIIDRSSSNYVPSSGFNTMLNSKNLN